MSTDGATLTETVSLAIQPTGCMTKDQAIALARSCGAVVWEGRAKLEMFHAGEDPATATPYDVIESEPNLLLTAGATLMWSLVCGAGGTPLNVTNAYVCAGNGTTAPAAGQTDLQGASKFRKLVSAAPALSTNQAQFSATFVEVDANFKWDELGIANASTAGTLLNRFLVPAFPTKNNTMVWNVTITLTLA